MFRIVCGDGATTRMPVCRNRGGELSKLYGACIPGLECNVFDTPCIMFIGIRIINYNYCRFREGARQSYEVIATSLCVVCGDSTGYPPLQLNTIFAIYHKDCRVWDKP